MKEKKSGLGEVIRFALTGGICFAIEFVCLVALKEGLGLDTLIATPIAFLISVIVNYRMCVRWVFPGAEEGGNAAKAGFLVTSLLGLLLNEGFMLLFRVTLGEERILFSVFGRDISMYMVNKALSTLLVMIWNFFTKKAILRSGLIARIFRKKDGRGE